MIERRFWRRGRARGARAWQKIALFFAIVGPAIGSLPLTAAFIVDAYPAHQPSHWAAVAPLALLAAAWAIGAVFVPAFAVGAAYASIAVRRGLLRGSSIRRVSLSLALGLVTGALLGVVDGAVPLAMLSCGLSAMACAAILEHNDYFDWIAGDDRP